MMVLMHVAMLLCAGLLGLWFYRYDRYDREPPLTVIATLALGFITMWAAGRLEDGAFLSLSAWQSALARATVVAMIEDGAKVVTVLAVARLFHRYFNDPMDGIIYGTFVGLGAGIEESLLYLSVSQSSMQTLAAEVVRLVVHAMMGGLVGFAVGFGAQPHAERRTHPGLMAMGLCLSLAFHILWDVIAYQPYHDVAMRAALMTLLTALVIVWGVMLTVADRRSRLIFAVQPASPAT